MYLESMSGLLRAVYLWLLISTVGGDFGVRQGVVSALEDYSAFHAEDHSHGNIQAGRVGGIKMFKKCDDKGKGGSETHALNALTIKKLGLGLCGYLIPGLASERVAYDRLRPKGEETWVTPQTHENLGGKNCLVLESAGKPLNASNIPADVDDQVSRLAQRLRDNNVSHNDIKHEELFVDEHGELKLLDWGFASAGSLSACRRLRGYTRTTKQHCDQQSKMQS
jgi:hypothetical protein